MSNNHAIQKAMEYDEDPEDELSGGDDTEVESFDGDGGEGSSNETSTDQRHNSEDSEKTSWQRKELDQQCLEVMTLLAGGLRRWDESCGSADIPVLEAYKKATLTARDMRDKGAPTVLHILARDYKKNYKDVPKDVRKTVIRYLLEHAHKNSYENRPEEAQVEPFLKLAMTYDNDEFIDCIIESWPDVFPDLLDIQDIEGKNCLHHIFAVPHLTPIPDDAFNRNAPTLAGVRRSTMIRGPKLVPMAMSKTLAAKDKDGNTPIHYAMDFRQCWGRADEYGRMVKEMVLKSDSIMKINGDFNKRGESPILYCRRTEKEHKEHKAARRAKQQAIQDKREKPKTIPEDKSKDNTKEPKSWRMSGTGTKASEGKPPLSQSGGDKPTAIKEPLGKTRDAPEDYGLRRSSTSGRADLLLPGSKPQALATNGKHPQAQSQVSPRDKMPRAPGRKKDGQISAEELLEFLRLHYIRRRSDLEARDLLDGKDVSDKNLYLDASCLDKKGAEKIIDLINRLSVGGFSDTLAYVYFPTIMPSSDSNVASKPVKKSYSTNHGMTRQSFREENPKLGRISLINVFDRLYAVGVRKILRLHVEDREASSHTDAAIERALQGRDSLTESGSSSRPISVETWDWRKPDLSTDVIAFAAPTVENVNLYWSGNQTVLKGWACPEGIPRLHATTGQKLKNVELYAAPGLESRDRMEKVLDRFKAEIKKHTADKVKVNVTYRMSGLLTKPDSNEEARNTAGGEAENKQHVWVENMDNFRTALRSIHSELEHLGIEKPARVKVAIIDDGVDLSNLDPYNDIVEATGLSYCPPEGNIERPWHESSGGHGTIMANMIARINPWASFSIMKLQAGTSNDGSRTIFADSAAKAILGAIARKVDIISMSWTVKEKIASASASSLALAGASGKESRSGKLTYEEKAINRLKEAVQAAVNAKILMFCSASDDIQAGGMDSLPYRQAPDYIFRIGAALALGQRDPHSEDMRRINYFFPGNQVAEAVNPRSAGTLRYRDGSSVATALAAGLASLIIYCAILVQSYHRIKDADGQSYIQFVEFVTALKERDKMRKAFDNIVSDNWDDKKYLPVWAVFGVATQRINGAQGEGKLQKLEVLVRDLCSKFGN